MSFQGAKFDEIGYWSEIKLRIVKEYAAAYSRILAAQTTTKFHHVYVDAFAGAGYHISRSTREFVTGSPLNALAVDPPFREYHFIDIDAGKAEQLRRLVGLRPDVFIYEGDCNAMLLDRILPRCRRRDFRRALWLLDPYGLHLNWSVLEAAGKEESIEVFLNFPVMDMNRNVLWHDHARVSQQQRQRMTRLWGDDSWKSAAYATQRGLFGESDERKISNIAVANAFCRRLQKEAGFACVPEPMPMRNTQGSVVYYLVFASQKPVAQHIVTDIFAKYRNKGERQNGS